ncbi:MAG: DUF3883 domain-containing protein [Candidatus Paceibacterota bacterium]|jgi:hypothetical protein
MNYFLAPRSGEKSYKNFESTIRNGIPLDRISSHLTRDGIEILSSEEVIYAWGNRKGTKSAWDKMKTGDTVIFYAKGVLVMTGEVYFKKHSPEMALAMWPADDNGNPWEYTFFLKNLKYISIPIKVFNAAVGFKLNYIVQGFTQLKEERINKIKDQYGSMESMFGLFKDPNSAEIPTINDKLYVNVSNEIIPIIIENQKLTPKIVKEKTGKRSNNKKIDYALRNKNNSIIGSRGEEIVLREEKGKLEKIGLKDLAQKVKRMSVDDDTLGYDILSFDVDGKEKYIEVKTSSSSKDSMRFFVSLNEYSIGKDKENYFIYFVENIDTNQPKITIIKNPIDSSKFSIQPDGYIFEAERN